MKKRCNRVNDQLDRWFELNEEQKQLIRSHAHDCAQCDKALTATEEALGVLQQSTEDYSRIKYSGPMPSLPEKRLAG